MASDTSSLHSFVSSSSSIRRKNNVTRFVAFFSALLSCLCAGSITGFSLYGHLFQERLHYTQREVNYVSIAAMLALYLPVFFIGLLCDRHGPAILSFVSAILFFLGYIVAAFTYRSGASVITGYTHERGWPLWVMVAAFALIGLSTTIMYMASFTTCAKNFGKSKYKGVATAAPVAAFSLSALWQSQIGVHVFYERLPDGVHGDVDVFSYFIFLSVVLLAVGLIGSAFQKVVNEDELIEEGYDALETSGLLPHDRVSNYGATSTHAPAEDAAVMKTWLLKAELKAFFQDRTMWLLAIGFFFISGPGETFLTNLGTIIGTLDSPSSTPTNAALHVSIVAFTSTVARLAFGFGSDLVTPTPIGHQVGSLSNSLASLPPRSGRFAVSRITFLLLATAFLIVGQLTLASGVIQGHPERFWIVSALMGTGYGALYSLMPLIITVIWGVENVGSNWGVVASVPALSALLWGNVYSSVYQWGAASSQAASKELLCHGSQCYVPTFFAMAASGCIGCVFLLLAWKGKDGWSHRGIVV